MTATITEATALTDAAAGIGRAAGTALIAGCVSLGLGVSGSTAQDLEKIPAGEALPRQQLDSEGNRLPAPDPGEAWNRL
jgi:hypothetical protein